MQSSEVLILIWKAYQTILFRCVGTVDRVHPEHNINVYFQNIKNSHSSGIAWSFQAWNMRLVCWFSLSVGRPNNWYIIIVVISIVTYLTDKDKHAALYKINKKCMHSNFKLLCKCLTIMVRAYFDKSWVWCSCTHCFKFKAWSWSRLDYIAIHALLAARFFLVLISAFLVHSPSFFSRPNPCFITTLVSAYSVSCVSPWNKTGHPACHHYEWCRFLWECQQNRNRPQSMQDCVV